MQLKEIILNVKKKRYKYHKSFVVLDKTFEKELNVRNINVLIDLNNQRLLQYLNQKIFFSLYMCLGSLFDEL